MGSTDINAKQPKRVLPQPIMQKQSRLHDPRGNITPEQIISQPMVNHIDEKVIIPKQYKKKKANKISKDELPTTPDSPTDDEHFFDEAKQNEIVIDEEEEK